METLIAQAIERQYAQRQRIGVKSLHRQISMTCRQRGLKAPSVGALVCRIKDFSPQTLKRRREGADAARTLTPVVGEQMPAHYPLHIIQMDHTKVDVIVVDSVHRQEIGRPYLTLAVDIYSRCVAGFVLTLEPPSALSVGLCMARIAEPKVPLLAKYGIEAEWPLHGKPAVLHTDNGSDFVSRALRQGCAAHGIELIHRPIGRPWYGGAIERIIGTFMKRVHELPGTTFSNVAERGDYPAQAKACMTLDELEHWLVYAIVAYHAEIHSRLGEPPLTRLQAGLKAFGTPPQVADSRVFLIDFLPVIRRRLSRDGFHLNNIVYYTPNLDALIERRGHYPEGFDIRYDPRNLRFIWVSTPDRQSYLEVPYRNLTHPDLSLWEHKAAVRQLRAEGKSRVDEEQIMRTALAQRDIVREASSKSRRARRQLERHAAPKPYAGSALPPESVPSPAKPVGEADIPVFTDLDVDW